MNDEQYVRENFIRAYDNCADNIFAYCYEKTAHRDVAKYLTRTIFMDAWDKVLECGQNINHMKSLIKRVAREHVADFITSQRNQLQFLRQSLESDSVSISISDCDTR
jgi:DNA-directed RNA polymerase specialized sigma24 family protein